MAKTLWAYTALLSTQDLLLEELRESETLTKLACEQILGSHSLVSAGLAKEGGWSLRHIHRLMGSSPCPPLAPSLSSRWLPTLSTLQGCREN